MAGTSGPIGGPHSGTLPEKHDGTRPSVRGEVHWARPRPQHWQWLEACRKTANSLPPLLIEQTNERTNASEASAYLSS